MGALYRVRQFLGALAPASTADTGAFLLLTPEARALFDRLSPAYRRHSARVLSRLQAAGHTEHQLLKAALLHDVGKAGAGITLCHRVLYVLLGHWAPGLLHWLAGTPAASGWRRPFYAQANHAALGAAMLSEIGEDPVVVGLVARHHDLPAQDDPPALVALRLADGDE